MFLEDVHKNARVGTVKYWKNKKMRRIKYSKSGMILLERGNETGKGSTQHR